MTSPSCGTCFLLNKKQICPLDGKYKMKVNCCKDHQPNPPKAEE